MNDLSKLTDTDLIRMFESGNIRGAEKLAERYKAKLYAYILFLVKDRYLAEDILQEVYIKIVLSLKAGIYQEEGKFSAWAMRISHNLCMDTIKSRHWTCSIETAEYEYLFRQADFDQQSPETRMIQLQTAGIVKNLLQYLSEEQKKVVVFRLYHNLSYHEIASLLNCSVNTAKGRMHHGLIKLRKMIRQKDVYRYFL